MLVYREKEGFVEVLWKRQMIGRIYKTQHGYVYRPRGCEWQIQSEPYKTIQQLKNCLEKP